MARLIDLSFDLAGRYAARLLADHGLEVVAVELPKASPAWPTVAAAGLQSVDLEALRDHLNRNKTIVPVDYAFEQGAEALEALIRDADVVVHTFNRGLSERFGLTAEAVKRLNPSALVVAITPYGHTGPDADKVATEKTIYAEGGGGLISGQAEVRFPLLPNLPVASTIGGLYGAMAVLAHALGGGGGGSIDIALRDLIPISLERVLSFYTYMKVVPFRGTRRERIDQAAAMGDFMAKDGAFHVFAQHDPYAKIAELIGRPDLVDNTAWLQPHRREMSIEEIKAIVADGVAGQTIAELEQKGRELGLPVGPVREVDQLADLPQLRHRKALARRPDGIEIEEPYRFFNFDRPRRPETPAASAARLPPKPPAETRTPRRADPASTLKGPLAGIRVLDLTHAYAGPSSTRILSDLGAEVIKVESVTHLDSVPRGLLPFDNNPTEAWWERAGYYADRNLGKKSLTLDMGSDEGRAIFVSLLDQVDVVATNFRPRVMTGWGLGPEALLARKPDLVVLSMSGFGGTGPDAEKPALAGLIEASSGFTALMRYEDDESPTDSGFSFGDMISGLYAAVATLMALDRRDRTGRGDAIDLSCCEGPLPLLAVQLHRWAREGKRPSVKDEIVAGGRHVVVRTGDADRERWAQVFVRPDQEETAAPTLGTDRSATVSQTRDAFVAEMRAKGFIAGPLADAEDLVFDPEFAARRLFQVVDRPSVGPLPYSTAFPVLRDGQPMGRQGLGPPPKLGEHSADIFAGLLGMTAARYADLDERHITGTAPLGKKSFLRWPLRLDDLAGRGRLQPVPGAAARMAGYFDYTLPEPEKEATKDQPL
ncbi:MAG: CoA transferase [Caulobacter sp.]|nr:CoA transferase [Caulobacter sp.]